MADTKPDTPRPEWELVEPQRELIRDLRGGSASMHAKTTKYLPQFEREPYGQYQIRLQNSPLVNYYRRSADGLRDMIFQEPVQLEASERIESWVDDVDGIGSTMDNFARDLLAAGIDDGIAFVIVDQPPAPEGEVTLADERAAQPVWKLARASGVVNWSDEQVGGRRRLTRLHVVEDSVEPDPDDEYAHVLVHRVRIYRPGLTELWREDEGGEWVLEASYETDYPEIPVAILPLNCHKFMDGRPLLGDVASLQLLHYRSYSDQNQLLRYARVPVLVAKGLTDPNTGEQVELEIGPASVVQAPSDGDLKYVEHSGKAIGAGAEGLKNIEDLIRVITAQTLLGNLPGGVTATAHSINRAEADSNLKMISVALEQCLNDALQITAFWMNENSEPQAMVFRDFAAAGNAEHADHLLKAVVAGALSKNSYWEALLRFGIMDPEQFDPATEGDRLDFDQQAEAALLANFQPADDGENDDGEDNE